jgi:hypothetical protein
MTYDTDGLEPTRPEADASGEFEAIRAALRAMPEEPVCPALLERIKAALRAELTAAGATEQDVAGDEFAPLWAALARLPAEHASAGAADRIKAALRAETAVTEEDLTGPAFARVWKALAAMPETVPVGLPARVKSAMRTAVPARRPVVVRGVFVRAAAAVACAAAVALAAWLGLRSSVVPSTGDRSLASSERPAARAVVEHDLTDVASVPEALVEAVESLADVRRQVESIGRGFDDMTQGTSLSLADEFPFLEKTFEETLTSGGGQ